MIDYLIDNDAAIKLIRYGLATEVFNHCCDPSGPREVGMLATARWVCARELDRAIRVHGEDASLADKFGELWASVVALEPAPEEVEFAAALEDEANRRGLAFDPGESQLVAMMTSRAGVLITGDKRAVIALEALIDVERQVACVAGRIASLEHVMMTLVVHLGAVAVSDAVSRAPAADTAMRLAFSRPPTIQGLLSYLASLRRAAPRSLVEADSICFEWLPQGRRKTA